MSNESVKGEKAQAAPAISPEMATFIERIKRHTETNASSLYDLFEKEGNSEAFQDALDDLVAKIAFQDPTYAANAQKLRNPRLNRSEGKAISEQQRATADTIKQLVIQEAGIPTEKTRTDIEQAQAAVLERLKDSDLTTSGSDELLRKLGILQEDENGDAVFHYPEGLFPESVDDKWNLYIAAVVDHMRKGNEVRRGGRPRTDLETADRARKFAHNRLSEDIHAILGFKNLPKEQWNFEDTRRLISKMRETQFVGKQTRESVITSQALARGMGALGLRVVEKLSERK